MEKMHHIDCECGVSEIKAKQYREFMCDPENEYNCNDCPERGISSTGLPCGQQNCWVSAHCYSL